MTRRLATSLVAILVALLPAIGCFNAGATHVLPSHATRIGSMDVSEQFNEEVHAGMEVLSSVFHLDSSREIDRVFIHVNQTWQGSAPSDVATDLTVAYDLFADERLVGGWDHTTTLGTAKIEVLQWVYSSEDRTLGSIDQLSIHASVKSLSGAPEPFWTNITISDIYVTYSESNWPSIADTIGPSMLVLFATAAVAGTIISVHRYRASKNRQSLRC